MFRILSLPLLLLRIDALNAMSSMQVPLSYRYVALPWLAARALRATFHVSDAVNEDK
jgi:hypothetical protein